MLLVSVSFVDRCWSYVITIMLFTYGLQLTILMILIPSRCPAVKYGLRIPWSCCLVCRSRTAKPHPLGREGGGVWWLRNTHTKKCTFLSHEAFSVKWEKYLFHCARTMRPFLRYCVQSDYLCTRTLIPVGITVVCGGGAWTASAFKERKSWLYEKRWKSGLFRLGEVFAC